MSVNINHPEDDISTSSSAPPTLGGQSPLVADNATVAADSSGNVSRWVMDTAAGSTGTEDGANTWCEIATFSMGTNDAVITTRDYLLVGFGLDVSTTRLHVSIKQGASGLSSTDSRLQVSNISGLPSLGFAGLSHDGFKLTAASATSGTDVKLWMRKTGTYGAWSIYELGKADGAGLSSVAYNNNAAWQSSTPSGAVNLTSDWAGGGWQSLTIQNGWAGTARYKKTASGIVYIQLRFTTAGTTTDGTLIVTIPSGFRPGIAYLSKILTGAISGGAAGRLLLYNADGTIKLYNYATSSAGWHADFVFEAEA